MVEIQKNKKKKEIPGADYLRKKYLRVARLPTMFCSGCGLGNIINVVARGLEEANINGDNLVLVSGIGCTARIPGYFDADSIHTTHGRAIPVATAIKMTNPSLDVVVISGDGDLMGIGGNHFIHAVRRNVGIKVICATNFTYGMTGGQTSPTTPLGMFSTSYPWSGNPEDHIDMAKLAMVGGAPYVVRWTTFQPTRAIKSIKKALLKPGFSFIELISPCPTNFGRRNSKATPLELKKWIEENTAVMKRTGPGMPHHEFFVESDIGKIALGKFQEIERETFEEKWKNTCINAKKVYLGLSKNEGEDN